MTKQLSVFLLAGIVAAGCSKAEPPPSTSSRELRFAVIPKALDIPVFNYARIGAERAAAELGNVRVEWRAPDTADQLRQKEILESFITQRVDGIAISALNGDLLTDTINRAVDAGIPVVTWDSDAPKSKRLAFYGVDDLESGRIMGREAIKLLGEKARLPSSPVSAPPICNNASTA
jgi:ribose transport system substrate-binding protein